MKLKLIIPTLFLLAAALIPLSAQEAPTVAPFLATNTPTRPTTDASAATAEPETNPNLVTVEMEERSTFEGQRFQIVGFEFERTDHSLGSVRITVKNISDSPASGQVWYMLAPPESSEPWNDAIYAATAQPIVDLAAGTTSLFVFDAPPADVIGKLSLSAWVHQAKDDGTTVHSDGVGYGLPLILAESVFLDVEYVDYVKTETAENLMFVTMTIHNYNDAMTEVAYSITLAVPDDPTPWETGAYVLPFQPLLLLPHQALTITVRSIIPPTDQPLEVIGWLQERVGEEMLYRNNDPYP